MAKQVAQLRYLRIAPRKVRSVGQLLTGLPVNEAEAQLLVQRRRASRPLLKLLRSAVANAKNNRRMNPEKLFVESLRVDNGPMLKRILPRARGSATPIHKIMSHVTITLAENENLKAPRFTIVIPKKTRLAPEERPKKKKEKTRGEQASSRPKGGGFFKRVFSRKSGTGT